MSAYREKRPPPHRRHIPHHLLRTFIEAGNLGTPGSRYTEAGIMWQTIIHTIFIVSAIGIAAVDRLQVPQRLHRPAGEGASTRA